MRLLLVSDTHGKLGIIDELSAEVHADAVIHAGDFGFYDDRRYQRLSERELRLHIKHSGLSPTDQQRILALPREEKIAAARAECPLSELPRYIKGKRRLSAPVYAVWGNHEDKHVVEEFFRGDCYVGNLNVLAGQKVCQIGSTFVFGIGGNILAGSKFLQRPIAGGAGRVWSTLSQFADLVETVDCLGAQPGIRIFVSHVSPGKEPFVELVAARTGADFTVSGHMGAPTCMVWNPFAIMSLEEATRRLRDAFEEMRKASSARSPDAAKQVEKAFALIGQILENPKGCEKRTRTPPWYRGMTHINLSDASVGYAVLDIEVRSTAIRTTLSSAAQRCHVPHCCILTRVRHPISECTDTERCTYALDSGLSSGIISEGRLKWENLARYHYSKETSQSLKDIGLFNLKKSPWIPRPQVWTRLTRAFI